MSSDRARIKIYARIKPTGHISPYVRFAAGVSHGDRTEREVEFNIPRNQTGGIINNQRENFKFYFDGVFDPTATQEDVFQVVASQLVLSSLDGYNSTVFAYGQTGSGKTHSIIGPERYSERGIIPRALSLLYNEFARRSDRQFEARISYVEIYNDQAYDLLDPKHQANSLSGMAKIGILEDSEGNIQFTNLHRHVAKSLEEALNLLLLGEINRQLADTPMNVVSSRSHCVFTVEIEAHPSGSQTVRRSKLHMVDLAGSERVSKTGVTGTRFEEAKHINKSLGFLEQVITALQEKNRAHIPYRNSKITMMLRDSLGGNCKTAMLATLNLLDEHLPESISTCRFAQRVACIKNEVFVNEELDPKLMVQRLKAEVAALKAEIALSGACPAGHGPLSDYERRQCAAITREWADAPPDVDVDSRLVGDVRMLKEAMQLLKAWLNERLTNGPQAAVDAGSDGPSRQQLQAEVDQLQAAVRKREQEIKILVQTLRTRPLRDSMVDRDTQTDDPTRRIEAKRAELARLVEAEDDLRRRQRATAAAAAAVPTKRQALEEFKRRYAATPVIEENQRALRRKLDERAGIERRQQGLKEQIERVKRHIEALRAERASQGLLEQADPEEDAARSQMATLRAELQQAFLNAREVQAEVDGLQARLLSERAKMKADFEEWYDLVYGPRPPPSEEPPSGESGLRLASPRLAGHTHFTTANLDQPAAPHKLPSYAWS